MFLISMASAPLFLRKKYLPALTADILHFILSYCFNVHITFIYGFFVLCEVELFIFFRIDPASFIKSYLY